MPFQTFTHNPTTVEAIQVAKPWAGVQRAVPFAHQVTKANGALKHLVISKPGDLETKRAYPGDWIIKYPTGCIAVMTDEQFEKYYGAGEERPDPMEFFHWLYEAKGISLQTLEEHIEVTDEETSELLDAFYTPKETADDAGT